MTTTTPTSSPFNPPASIEQALSSARLHLDEAATNLDLVISGPGVAPTGSVGSASDDPAKHRGRFADPSRSLTDHLEDLIRVDDILTRSFPSATSSDRIKAAVEILSVLRWESL